MLSLTLLAPASLCLRKEISCNKQYFLNNWIAVRKVVVFWFFFTWIMKLYPNYFPGVLCMIYIYIEEVVNLLTTTAQHDEKL